MNKFAWHGIARKGTSTFLPKLLSRLSSGAKTVGGAGVNLVRKHPGKTAIGAGALVAGYQGKKLIDNPGESFNNFADSIKNPEQISGASKVMLAGLAPVSAYMLAELLVDRVRSTKSDKKIQKHRRTIWDPDEQEDSEMSKTSEYRQQYLRGLIGTLVKSAQSWPTNYLETRDIAGQDPDEYEKFQRRRKLMQRLNAGASTGLAGALVGAMSNRENRGKGALIGGAIGTPIGVVLKALSHTLKEYQGLPIQ